METQNILAHSLFSCILSNDEAPTRPLSSNLNLLSNLLFQQESLLQIPHKEKTVDFALLPSVEEEVAKRSEQE